MRKTPQMYVKQPKNKVISPYGGINTSLLDNEINDNQLSDGLNVWYYNSMLRMRPGLMLQITQEYGKIVDVYPKDGSDVLIKRAKEDGVITEERHGIYILTERTAITYNGTDLEEIPTGFEFTDGVWIRYYNDPAKKPFTNAKLLPSVIISPVDEVDMNGTIFSITGTEIFILGGKNEDGNLQTLKIVPNLVVWPFPMGETHVLPDSWVTTHAAKIPTLFTNLKANGSGDSFQARNYLTPEVKVEYITDNSSLTYQLPDKNIDNAEVQIIYNPLNFGGEVLFIMMAGVTTSTSGGLTVTLNRAAGTLTFNSALVNGTGAALPNMIVFYSKSIYTTHNPILNSNIAAWFGGNYQGQTSGDSLFLSGNPYEPNAVYWSAVNDPYYFPINFTDYVGSPSDKVVAFGKNFSKLVIFKENSVYEKGFYYDNVTQKQSFPTNEIHVGIGCDMPNSVQIINNNLVWCNSKGGIYTIATTSRNDERVVLPLSANINKQLLANTKYNLQDAVSIDTGTYYMLFVGKNVYIWDYNSTPFIDYTNMDIYKLQNRLAWYVWSIPKTACAAFMYNNRICIGAAEDNALYHFDIAQGTDDGMWYDAYIISKSFDFDLPFVTKQIEYLALSIACSGVVDVEITLIDENDTYTEVTSLIGGDIEAVQALSLRQLSSWTKQFKLGVGRANDDIGQWGIASYTIKAKIGREV